MEMRCVRSLPFFCNRLVFNYGEQSEVWTDEPLHAFQNLSTEILVSFKFKLANGRTRGRAVAYWLRRYITNRQVASSIPDGVIGIFQ
jgi:hypothetical protein